MRHLLAAVITAATLAVPYSASAQDNARFPPLRADELTPEQKAWADSIALPPRNAKFTNPPYRVYIRNPTLAPKLQAISDYVRWNTSLPPRLSEFAIMIGARHWSVPYEWRAHYVLAVKGGLDRHILTDLGAGNRPQNMKDDETALYDFVTEMYRDKNISDATFSAALAKFGERGVMDLIGIIGYYDIASMALIVQKTPAEPVADAPLLPLTR
jgi:4-carboxymuconolactone decarboxylase